MDSYLSKHDLPPVFEWMCGGVFSDQKMVKACGCEHEREQPFVLLPVAVRNNATLESALAETIRGETIEDYRCERCNVKDTAVKRMCVKRLPRTLFVHLKRFDFDWTAQETVKFNDKFVFPDELDMFPYTTAGVAAKDAMEQLVTRQHELLEERRLRLRQRKQQQEANMQQRQHQWKRHATVWCNVAATRRWPATKAGCTTGDRKHPLRQRFFPRRHRNASGRVHLKHRRARRCCC